MSDAGPVRREILRMGDARLLRIAEPVEGVHDPAIQQSSSTCL